MTELVTHTDFSRGIVTDGDPNKDSTFKEMRNLDLVRDDNYGNVLRVRPPVKSYTERGFNPALIPSPTYNSAAMTWWGWYEWQSGLGSEVQTNALLVFRIADGDYYRWTLYSNAPAQSDAVDMGTSYPAGAINTWAKLEEEIIAADIQVAEEGGRIRISLGCQDLRAIPWPTNDSRIFMDLCPGNKVRSYFSGQQTIQRSTDARQTDKFTWTGSVDYSTLGNGGKVFKGWLYDYSKLYEPWKQPTVGANELRHLNITIGARNTDPDTPLLGNWLVAVVPVYDDDPAQIGVPYVAEVLQDPANVYGPIDVKIGFYTGAPTSAYSPRITGFAIYAQRRDHPNSDDMDGLLRVYTVPILSPSGTSLDTVYSLDEGSLLSGEGSWEADTGGREIIKTTARYTTQVHAAGITVKPTGLVMRKEVLYAWGTEDDPGQAKIRFSELPSLRGNYDVFPKSNVMWKSGVSRSILSIQEWDDRLVAIHNLGMFHVEPADPLRSRDSYTLGADSLGIGIPKEFFRTLIKCKRGVFFANYEGVWVFRDGRIQNILEKRRLTEWLGYSEDSRATAIGGYHAEGGEYWLSFMTDSSDTSSWVTWIYNDTDIEIQQWREYAFAGFVPYGYLADEDNNFIMFGTRFGSRAVAYLDTDASGVGAAGRDFGTTAIPWQIGCNFMGQRRNEMVIEALNIERNIGETVTVELFMDGFVLASQLVTLLSSRKDIVPVIPMLCNETRYRVTGTFETSEQRPEIYEVTLFGHSQEKRRK